MVVPEDQGVEARPCGMWAQHREPMGSKGSPSLPDSLQVGVREAPMTLCLKSHLGFRCLCSQTRGFLRTCS